MMETVVPNAVLFVRLSSIGGFRGVDTPEALPRPRADGDNRLRRDVGVTPTRYLSLQCMTPPAFYLAPKCCAQGFAGLCRIGFWPVNTTLVVDADISLI